MLSTKKTIACTQARAVACPPRASTIARAQPEKAVLPALAAIMLAFAPAPAFAESGVKATVNALSEGVSNLKNVEGNVEELARKENAGVRGVTELYNQADAAYYNRRFGGDNPRLFAKGAPARRTNVDITAPTPDNYKPSNWFRTGR